MIMVYLFDGTFDGFMTCVYEGYYSDSPSGIYSRETYLQDLFEKAIDIATDHEKAFKVSKAIVDKLSEHFFHKILNAFFSEQYDIYTQLYEVIQYGFKEGPEVIMNMAHPIVEPVFKWANAVGRETHLLVGLVRFVRLKSDIYYCQFKPTYNQVVLLAEHFSQRMGSELWVIHDIERHLAVFFDKTTWYVKPLYGLENYELADDEIAYQKLWKTFHHHIAIKERTNPRLQRSFMPKKYWKYLIEMN